MIATNVSEQRVGLDFSREPRRDVGMPPNVRVHRQREHVPGGVCLEYATWQMFVEGSCATLGVMTLRSMTSTRVRITVAAAVAILALLAPPASAKSPDEAVNGRWVGLVPCVPTTPESVTSDHVTCTGSTTWAGTWTGVTNYTIDATFDAVTGAADGTVDETFVGRDDHGRIGTLRFTEKLVGTPTGIPDTQYLHIDACIVGATGDFAGATGHVGFDGVANLAGGTGTFSGHWRLPRTSGRDGHVADCDTGGVHHNKGGRG